MYTMQVWFSDLDPTQEKQNKWRTEKLRLFITT